MYLDTTPRSEVVQSARPKASVEPSASSASVGPSGRVCSPIARPWLNRFFLGAAVLVAAAGLWRVQTAVRWNLASPFDLVFESPNLATIQTLREGLNIYDPAVFNSPPFVFTLYTPLYHLICAALPTSAANPFLAGRLVAFGFMALALLGVFWAARGSPSRSTHELGGAFILTDAPRSSHALRLGEPRAGDFVASPARPRSWPILLLSVGLFCLVHPVSANAAFLKNDATALFFSVLALLLLTRHSSSRLGLAGAALCCVLALASKQVFVSASAACLIFLLARPQRRDAFRFGAYYLLFAAAGAGLAHLVWGNGFWFCVWQAPRMPFDSAQFAAQWGLMLRQPAFLTLNAFCLLAVAGYLRSRKGQEAHSRDVGNWFWRVLPAKAGVPTGTPASAGSTFPTSRECAQGQEVDLFFLYFLFTQAVLLLTVGKPGSSTNYFIEPSLAGVFLLASRAPSLLARDLWKGVAAGVCLVAAVAELATARPRDFAFADPSFGSWRARFHQSLLAEAASLPLEGKPLRVLNLATASTFYDWPGETSVNDPYLYSLLWERGVLPPEPMLRELHAQTYDLIVFRKGNPWVTPKPGSGLARILEATREFYHATKSEAGFEYWTRARRP